MDPKAFTWCLKRQDILLTADLTAQECLNCHHFILNGGYCLIYQIILTEVTYPKCQDPGDIFKKLNF